MQAVFSDTARWAVDQKTRGNRGWFAFGIAAYLAFQLAATAMIVFCYGAAMPWNAVDHPRGSALSAVLWNLGLTIVFGLQHSVMARPRFKAWISRMIPVSAERSVYVMASAVATIALAYLWRPIDGYVWKIETPWISRTMLVIWAAGWGLLVWATYLIDHFELFGLKQSLAAFRGKPLPENPAFATPGAYKWIRHPIYLGWLIGFWCVPEMTTGRLVFSIAMSAYIFVGVAFEERDLIRRFGPAYVDYKKRVPMLLPKLRAASPERNFDVGDLT